MVRPNRNVLTYLKLFCVCYLIHLDSIVAYCDVLNKSLVALS